MKTTLTFLPIFFLSFLLQAQVVWAPIGAEWHYYREFTFPGGPTLTSIYKYKIEKDTMVLGQECRLMKLEVFEDDGGHFDRNLYTFSQNDSVYIYYPFYSYEGFRLEFDFGAELNDEFSSYTLSGSTNPETDTSSFMVVDVSNFVLGGNDLMNWTAFRTSVSGEICGMSQNYMERIGKIRGFERNECIVKDPSPIWALRCYKDSTFSYNSGVPCDSLILSDGLNLSEIAKVEIFPNPVQEALSIKLPDFSFRQTSVCSLFDLQGRKVKTLETKFPNTTYDLNVADLANGIYFLTWVIDGEIIRSRQVFVN